MAEVNLTVRLDLDLKTAFTEAAKAKDRTAGQLIRDFARDYVQKARDEESYEAWFRRKVEAGLIDARAGRGSPNGEVEARFAARRAALRKRADEAGR